MGMLTAPVEDETSGLITFTNCPLRLALPEWAGESSFGSSLGWAEAGNVASSKRTCSPGGRQGCWPQFSDSGNSKSAAKPSETPSLRAVGPPTKEDPARVLPTPPLSKSSCVAAEKSPKADGEIKAGW